jgi:haloalkane dehalogenase
MWAQGVFRTRATTTQWGIDFIAANLEIPTTTLHYPTMAQFIAEIRKGYDYIGIAFVVPTFHKLRPMIAAIREHAPRSKIILGGYGTTLGDELAPLADHICQGEGVAFMRRLLGEPVDAPIVQPDITQTQSLFSMPILGEVGYVFAGLGCPNGCDFCATSHYYKQQHIRFLPDGPAILRAIRDLRAAHPGMTDFWISDEDFLLDEARGRSFLEAIRQSELPPLALSVFGSVKALSQYTASELVEMGIDWVWIGYEGQRAGYAKMQGRPYRELFADLHQHGISVLASMIIGFDYQTPAIIQAEFEELMSLRPTMSQFLIYGPARGTPGHARMLAEGRLLPEMAGDTPKHDGFYSAYRHPVMRPEELEAIHRRLYREEFQRLGPAVFRVVDDYLAGYLSLRDHSNLRIRGKAEKYRQIAHRSMMLLPASRRHLSAPSAAWVGDLLRRLTLATGPMTMKERLMSRLAAGLIRYTAFKQRHGLGQQPEFSRRSFRMDGLAWTLAPLPSLTVPRPEG